MREGSTLQRFMSRRSRHAFSLSIDKSRGVSSRGDDAQLVVVGLFTGNFVYPQRRRERAISEKKPARGGNAVRVLPYVISSSSPVVRRRNRAFWSCLSLILNRNASTSYLGRHTRLVFLLAQPQRSSSSQHLPVPEGSLPYPARLWTRQDAIIALFFSFPSALLIFVRVCRRKTRWPTFLRRG